MSKLVLLSSLLFLGCSLPREWETYGERKEQEIRRKKARAKYSIDLNNVLDNFYLYSPTKEAVLCATEMEEIIESRKRIQLSQTMLENLLILCQRMIWDKED